MRISGINWFGFDTINAIVGGLQQRSYKSILIQIKELNFNVVRLTFSNEMLLWYATPAQIDFTLNPDLVGLSPLQIMDAVISYCGTIGLGVILVRRSALAGNFYNEQLWYVSTDPDFSEQKYQQDWTALAKRYLNSAVIAADLWDEPKDTADWPTWSAAATAAGNAVLQGNPNLLIIVQGVGASGWWGGNLQGVATTPITLNVPNKLVYSAHDFAVDTFPQPWLTSSAFPGDLRPRWTTFFGYIFQQNIAPLFIGSFGTDIHKAPCAEWMQLLMNYMNGQFVSDGVSELTSGQLGLSWSIAAVNADYAVTGLLTLPNWQSVDMYKLAYLTNSFGKTLNSKIKANFPTSTPANYPSPEPFAEPTPQPVPVINPRATCVTENFDSLNFQYFSPTGCGGQMSILPGGYLQLLMVPSCSNVRLDSKSYYSNAYVETKFKIGGQGPDFSGPVYSFYSDAMTPYNGLHANEIDVEIVGNGNPAPDRGWFQNSVQLGIWVPNYALKQYFINQGTYDMSDNFVKYAFQWNYNTVDFFINDQYVYSSSKYQPSLGYMQPEKIIYSLWDASQYPDFSQPINWNSPQASNFKMIIDYVTICY